MALDHLKRPNPKRPEPTKPTNGPPAEKATAPPPKPTLKYQCGHTVALAHLESLDCPGCREGRRKAKARQRSETNWPPTHEWPCRLPAGSEKLIHWTGTAWVGVLKVPGEPGFEATVEAETERECCHGLHRLYVESLDPAAVG